MQLSGTHGCGRSTRALPLSFEAGVSGEPSRRSLGTTCERLGWRPPDARYAGKQAYRRCRRSSLGRPARSQRRSEPGFAGGRKLRCALPTAGSYVAGHSSKLAARFPRLSSTAGAASGGSRRRLIVRCVVGIDSSGSCTCGWCSAGPGDSGGPSLMSKTCPGSAGRHTRAQIQRQEIRAMNFELSDRAKDVPRAPARVHGRARLSRRAGLGASRCARPDSPHVHPPVMEELKAEARRRGLWNLFLPDAEHGAGLADVEYAPLAEIMGRTKIAAEACNCTAPDTGNMEVLHQFGTRRAAGPLAAAAARRRDPLGLRDDRAGRRVIRRDEHHDAHRARRRRVRAQRSQVVDDGRAAPQLPHPRS